MDQKDRFPHIYAVCEERGIVVAAEKHAQLPDSDTYIFYFKLNDQTLETVWSTQPPSYDALFGMLHGAREVDTSKALAGVLPGHLIEEPKQFKKYYRWRSMLIHVVGRETYDLLIGAMLADYQIELARKEQK